MDVILFFVACCPLSCISWTPAALCSLPLGNCCPALSHSQQEPLPAAPERWWLVTVAANFFSFTRSQPPFFHFGDSSPWFLAWLQQAPGETGEGQPCGLSSLLSPAGRGGVERHESPAVAVPGTWDEISPHCCSSHLVQRRTWYWMCQPCVPSLVEVLHALMWELLCFLKPLHQTWDFFPTFLGFSISILKFVHYFGLWGVF